MRSLIVVQLSRKHLSLCVIFSFFLLFSGLKIVIIKPLHYMSFYVFKFYYLGLLYIIKTLSIVKLSCFHNGFGWCNQRWTQIVQLNHYCNCFNN